jgi:hypothetical protein
MARLLYNLLKGKGSDVQTETSSFCLTTGQADPEAPTFLKLSYPD